MSNTFNKLRSTELDSEFYRILREESRINSILLDPSSATESEKLNVIYDESDVNNKLFMYANAYSSTDLPVLEQSESLVYIEQVEAYQKLLDEMMELHLKKIKDYGPDAINATGEIGITVRMWDKMARLLHLSGWDMRSGTKSTVKSPNNESIDDTLMDLASYALIMLVYRQGKWGK